MSLRLQAAADLKTIVEDSAAGFGWEIRVTDPAGIIADLIGLSTDVAQSIDAETGVAVSGRAASVTLSLSSLEAAGLGIPRAIADSGKAPWLVEFKDVGGCSHLFAVLEALPDRAIGAVVCLLQFYQR